MPFASSMACTLAESFFLITASFLSALRPIVGCSRSFPVIDPFLMSAPVISLAAAALEAPATSATITQATIVLRMALPPQR